jgi:hypothetical protein
MASAVRLLPRPTAPPQPVPGQMTLPRRVAASPATPRRHHAQSRALPPLARPHSPEPRFARRRRACTPRPVSRACACCAVSMSDSRGRPPSHVSATAAAPGSRAFKLPTRASVEQPPQVPSCFSIGQQGPFWLGQRSDCCRPSARSRRHHRSSTVTPAITGPAADRVLSHGHTDRRKRSHAPEKHTRAHSRTEYPPSRTCPDTRCSHAPQHRTFSSSPPPAAHPCAHNFRHPHLLASHARTSSRVDTHTHACH